MTSILSGISGPVAAVLAMAVGIVYGLFMRQKSKAVQADASAQVAQAQMKVEQTQAAVDQANTQAAQVAAEAVENRQQADAAVAATPDTDLDAQLAQIGALRKD